MPAPKYTVRWRYFTERDPHEDPLPDERLLYLELLEIDEEAGVARFAYEIAAPDGELWLATVKGWASRDEVQEAVKEATAFMPTVTGGVLSIPLSADPQVTQIEVRRLDDGSVTPYRVLTQGMDPRTFRYETLSEGDAIPWSWVRWEAVEGEEGVYQPVLGGGDVDWIVDGEDIVLAMEPDGSVRTLARQDDNTLVLREEG